MTSKRWLGLLVSGVCHKGLGEIEDLEAKLDIARDLAERRGDIEICCIEALAKIKENTK